MPTPVARSARAVTSAVVDAFSRVEIGRDAGQLVGAEDGEQRRLGAEPGGRHSLVGALAARPHVEIGAEHGLAEDRQLRRPHGQPDREAADDGDDGFRHDRRLAHDVMARARIASSLIARAGELAGNAAAAQDQHALGVHDQLRQSPTRSSTIATPSPAMPRRIWIDLRLGADIDAARRLVQDEHARIGHQAAAEDDLLLVAAGQRRKLLAEMRDASIEPRHLRTRLAPDGAAAQKAATGETRQ